MLTIILILIILSALIAVICISRHRIAIISSPLLSWSAKRTTTISETERAALEAGTTWWERTIFYGQPDWQTLMETAPISLSDEEQSFIDNEVEQLCDLVDDWGVSQSKDLSLQAWEFAKNNRLFGLNIPRDFGGLGFSAAAQSAVVCKLATRSSALAVTVMVPNSLGPAELIVKYGTQQQKDYYLPRLATGQEIPCFGLTSEKAGSDATSIDDYAVVCEGEFEGKQCLGLKLNWSKRYITLAPVATLLGLAVKVFDPDGLLDPDIAGGQKELGITCVLVPTHLAGCDTGDRHNPMDIFFQNGPTSGEDVFVPLDSIIGGVAMVGQGWKMLVECLVVGRALSLPALASAASQVALYTTSGYAQVRQQFGRPIGKFGGIQWGLSELAMETYSVYATRDLTVAAIDSGVRSSVLSAMIKYSATEASRVAINHAMDIHAGKAIIQGPQNYLGLLYKSLPISITVEGSNILTRSLIIFAQGVLRCHPFLADEISCIEQFQQIKQSPSGHQSESYQALVEQFDKLLSRHIKYHFKSLFRAVGLMLSRGRGSKTLKLSSCTKYLRQTNYLSAIFAYLSDLAVITIGSKLKHEEMLSGRFADALMMIYTACAALKCYQDKGQSDAERDLVCLVCEHRLYAAEKALYEICQNFTPKVLSWWTRFVLFPLGLRLTPPRDHLRKRVAKQLLERDELRKSLSQDIHYATYSSLDRAIELCRANETLLRAVRKQKREAWVDEDQWLDQLCQNGSLTAGEVQIIKDCRAAITEVIRVDSFEKL